MELFPLFSDAYYNRACAFGATGRVDLAAADYQKARELSPIYVELRYSSRAIYDGARDTYDKAVMGDSVMVSLDRGSAEIYIRKGNSLSNELVDDIKYAEAIKLLTRAVDCDARDPAAYVARGNIYKKKAELLKINEDKPASYNRITTSYKSVKEYENAFDDYHKAIRLDPRYPDAYYYRGVCYQSIDAHKEATADFTKTIELDPKHIEAYIARGSLCELKDDYEGAMDNYTCVIDLEPSRINSLLRRGNIFVKKGDFQKALEDYSQAIKRDPRCVDAYQSRGAVYEKLGKDKEAIDDYERAGAIISQKAKSQGKK